MWALAVAAVMIVTGIYKHMWDQLTLSRSAQIMGDKNKVHYFVLSGPLVMRNVKTVSFWPTGLLFYFIF